MYHLTHFPSPTRFCGDPSAAVKSQTKTERQDAISMREGDIHSLSLPVRAASNKPAPCRQHGLCLHSSPTKPPLSPSGQPQDADRQPAAAQWPQHPTSCVSSVSNCFATAVAPCICSAGKQKCSDSVCSHLQATHWCDTKEDQARDGVLVLIKLFVIPVIT